LTLPAAPAKPHATQAKRLDGQRARSPQDKDLRRGHLVQAAAELFAQADFDGVTIAKVASRAGVAKGTAYLYFNCKEALFLELVQSELNHWEQELGRALEPLGATITNAAVSVTIARTLAARPTLGRLLVLLHTVIEPQLDFETARSFKLFLRDLVQRLSSLFAASLPGLGTPEAVTFVLQIHALVISVSQLAAPPPIIAQVLAEDASLQAMRVEFEPFLAVTLATLLRGTLQGERTIQKGA